MLSKILRGAVLATFAVGATVAQADPFADPIDAQVRIVLTGRSGDSEWLRSQR